MTTLATSLFNAKELKAILYKGSAAGVLLAWVINLQLQVNNLTVQVERKDDRIFALQSQTIKDNTSTQKELISEVKNVRINIELLTSTIKNQNDE